MKQSLGIISFYYPPEMGAASNRIHQMAMGLKDDFDVTVITPLPNYPKGRIFKDYRGKLSSTEISEGIRIKRLWVLATNSKLKIPRLLGMLSYSLSLCIYFITHKPPKTVIVQCPPLLMAFTCVLFLRKRKIILNISDLWPLVGKELGVLKPGIYYNWLLKIEQFNYNNSNLILGQSEEIIDRVNTIAPRALTFLYRNYPKIESRIHHVEKSSPLPLKIVYAGLLGHAQGILKLCQSLNYDYIEFHIFGAGPEASDIKNWINGHSALPVYYHSEIKRSQLHATLTHYDLAIIPLVKPLFGSTPSKIFEYASIGLPLLYFAGGEGQSIVANHRLGWVVECGNYNALNQRITQIAKTGLNTMNRNELRDRALALFDFEAQLNHLKTLI